MHVLICQNNTTPGDFAGNFNQIETGVINGDKCDLVVFPELSIPGYLCKDMMFRKGFIEDNLDVLKAVADLSENRSPTIIVGYIDKNYSGSGKPFRNMAAVIKNGIVVATYQKHLLPFYDVFDEGRYFQPGTELSVVEICGVKWGICICEDLWNDKGSDDYNYKDNPLESYRKIGINNIISINSSPYVRGKPHKRVDMIKRSSDAGTIIYCNQIGGQDELVFDGNSFIVNNHQIVASTSDTKYLKAEIWEGEAGEPAVDDNVYDMLKLGLRDYVYKSGFKKVIVGSSGGIDSALTIALACDAIGPQNVHGVRMPSIISSEHSSSDAAKLHHNLGCRDYEVPIQHESFIDHILNSLDSSKSMMGRVNPLANENIQARLRGLVLMYLSNAYGALLLTTGNKTELALGYCTIYGDMNGGFAPISDLYKLEVYNLARYYNKNVKDAIPENIFNKAPSAELAPGQTDESSLLPYPILDSIVRGYIEEYIADFESYKKWWPNNDHFDGPNAALDYAKMIKLINVNEFKRRQAAPGIKVSKVAFGIGRRLPIVKG